MASAEVAGGGVNKDNLAIGAEGPEGEIGMNSAVKSTTRRKSMRVATALTGMTLAAGVAGVVVAAPAYAGTNGQQIRVCGLRKSYHVQVSGPNQNGTNVVWEGHAEGNCITTTGFWWKGRLFLYAASTNYVIAMDKYCTVPKNYPTDVYACGNI